MVAAAASLWQSQPLWYLKPRMASKSHESASPRNSSFKRFLQCCWATSCVPHHELFWRNLQYISFFLTSYFSFLFMGKISWSLRKMLCSINQNLSVICILSSGIDVGQDINEGSWVNVRRQNSNDFLYQSRHCCFLKFIFLIV